MASLKQRPDGRWRARYVGEDGKEHAAHRPTKKAAQEWLDEQTVALRSGAWVDPKTAKVTLASFYSDWATRQVWANGTMRAMDTAMKGCTFRDKPLRDLRRSHVESWVKTLTTTLAPGTVRTRFNNVRSVLRAAVKDRLLGADPSEGVALPRLRRAAHAMSIPTPEQVGRMLEACDLRLRPLVLLGAFAGLRIGEVAAVRLSDVDFLRRHLHVQRQVQWHEGAIELVPPKYGSERHVALSDGLLIMLSEHKNNVGVYGADEYLFAGKDGLPPSGDQLRHNWRAAVKSVGLGEFTPHDLRHFYASGLIAAGADVVTVQRALGHAKATTTLDTYSHLWPTAEDRTRVASGAMLAEALQNSADFSRTRDTQKA
ncbi:MULTISPECIES: site-specific integrase [unclassified Frondihabitans]|uniref:tyrosine-type recombinase/integrase n=1 Tax=unclassified Frondihabitans TaxID=2626248 RepID=UPI000F4D2F58|nr:MULTISPECIES: site-specific integrase [unclassified Frondihabitans]RPE75214.1 site-specific recombinase XerD [Frondihabitans sp. PhB153]RPF04456.1 site-specific recombinase XerD [Frondihabitans sp. PhB161]